MSDLSAVLDRIAQIQALVGSEATGGQSDGSAFADVLAGQSGGADAASGVTDGAASSGTAAPAGSGTSAGSGAYALSLFGGTAVALPATTSGTSSGPSSGGSVATGGVTGAQVVADARRYLGVPYVWGGTTPQGFDCSGLVQHVYADLGISLPRTSEEQALVGQPVSGLGAAQPGDLVFFAGSDGTTTSPGHVGIYVGNGEMLDAPYTGTDVQIQPVSSAGTVVAIRRIVADPSAATASPAATTDRPAGLGLGSYAGDFVSAGARYGVPATLLASVARTESGLDPQAVSSAGAEGLMQLMPQTAASLGVDPWVPAQAVDGAAQLLSQAYQQFGSWPLAVAAYNAGVGAVQEYGGIPPYPQTEAYVTKVMAGAGMTA